MDDAGTPAPPADGRLPYDRAREAVAELSLLLRVLPEDHHDAVRRVADILARAFDAQPEYADELRAPLQDLGTRTRRILALSAERAVELLDVDPGARALAVFQEGDRLVRDLGALGRRDLVLRLTAGVTGLFGDPDPARRRAALDALHTLRRVWDDPAFTAARAQVEKDIRRALAREVDLHVYAALADLSAFCVESLFHRGDLDAAADLLDVLQGHAPAREDAGRALERLLAGDALSSLGPRVRSGDPAALRVLGAFGERAPRRLLLLILRQTNPQARARLTDLLSRTGPAGVNVVLEACASAAERDDALRLLEVLPRVAPETAAVAALAGLLRHAEAPVRRKAAALIGERGYEHAGALLLTALVEEKDPDLRVGLVDALGRVGCAEAVPVLAALAAARQESDVLRGSACAALGRIGEAEAVPHLKELAARPARGLTAILRPGSGAVRAAALRALGAFVEDVEVRAFLTEAADDRDPLISAAAREALRDKLVKAFAEKSRESTKTAEGPARFAGSLLEIPLDQVCQLIAHARKTGLLRLTLGTTTGRVWFEDGLVTAADYLGQVDQDAFNELVRRPDGAFAFQANERAPEGRLRVPVTTLLIEALRVRDEGARVA